MSDQLFVWDGEQVGGDRVQVGGSSAPILLTINYPIPHGASGFEGDKEPKIVEIVSGFAKSMTLKDLRVCVWVCVGGLIIIMFHQEEMGTLLECPSHCVVIAIVKQSTHTSAQVVTLAHSKVHLPLTPSYLSSSPFNLRTVVH